jgi:hypothetical protein
MARLPVDGAQPVTVYEVRRVRAVVISAEVARAGSVGSTAAQTASGSKVCAHSSTTKCDAVASIAAFGVAGNTFRLRLSRSPAA